MRRQVKVSITKHRGIGQHYYALIEESGPDGKSYQRKFDSHLTAGTWVLQMVKKHFPVKTHRLIHSSREGPWFYRSSDDS